MLTTPGRLLFNDIVPEKFRVDMADDQPATNDSIKNILQKVAEQEPESYRDISHKLLKLGAKASTEVSASFSLDDLDSPIDKKPYIAAIEKQEALINARKDLTPEQKDNERVKLYLKLSYEFPEQVYQAAYSRGSNLANMVASGARGNKSQLNSNIGADWLIMDPNGDPVPIPIKSSYSEGLSPAEYFAGSFGTRSGLVATKFSTAQSGYLAKLLSAAAHDLTVTEDDCATSRGVPVQADDKDNVGSILAQPVGDYAAGTIITSRMMSDLKKVGEGKILVRSPITCAAKGGVCAHCTGMREHNRLPKIGENVGLAATSSISEPLSQGMLCLAEGTMVRMASGTSKPIQDIQPGDLVLGANKTGGFFPVRVLNRFDNGLRECCVTRFISEDQDGWFTELISTKDHKILCVQSGFENEVLPVATEGDSLRAVMFRGFATRDSITPLSTLPTFDIEVDHPDHLFVLANGMIVSNSSKHGGGVASAGSSRSASGFKAVEQLVNIPEEFEGGAVVADTDGRVTNIEEAPQGGQFVYIGDKKHHVPSVAKLNIKKGDEVEAGDALTDGTPSPADVVKYKGVGRGRTYFMEAMRKAFKDNGLYANRRNLEVISRSIINHVKVTNPEGMGDYLPDDVVEYNSLESSFVPESSKPVRTSDAIGKFIQRPVLDYSVGTRITPRVQKELDGFGIKEIEVSDSSPGFEPEMQRITEIPGYHKDWMAQFGGAYLKKRLLQNVQSGKAVSEQHGTSYIPGLAKGIEFGLPKSKDQGPY